MKITSYPQHRKSDIPFVLELPSHWKTGRLKHISSTAFSSVDKHSLDDEIPVKLCNYVDVYYNDSITPDLNFMQATATSSEISRFSLKEGDVLVTKDSEEWNDIAIPAHVPAGVNDVVCGYHLAQVHPNTSLLHGKYLFRAFSARGINDQFRVEATGVTRYGLGKYALDNALFPVPPLPEQKSIAAFLDRETGRIDSLIAKKEKQIELLQRKRAALISQAVTKGLDPKAKMKNSGVEWLGEVPEHWLVERLRFHAIINPCKSETFLHPDLSVSFVPMEDLCIDGGINLDKTKLVSEVSTGYTYFRDGDMVFAKITPCFENGKCSIASSLQNGVAFGTTELHVLRPTQTLLLLFLFYVVSSHPFRKVGESYMYGAGGQKRVPDDFVRNFRFSIPPISKQQQIVSYLNRQCAHIAALSTKLQYSITKLNQYRTSLISSAVTGKIDVRKESQVAA